MRLISWNCQGAFRKKSDVVLQYRPDILIIQECEQIEKLNFSKKPLESLWFGDNKNKGLAIFSFGDIKLHLYNQLYYRDFKIIIPLLVSNGNLSLNLFAIWANNPCDQEYRYIGQVWKAVNYYDQLLNGKTILIGDFNSNKIWDKNDQSVSNHSAVVNRLIDKNIFSVYHQVFDQKQGKETTPTFYMQRNKNKPYHIDYCFASKELHGSIKKFEIGSYENGLDTVIIVLY